MRPRARSRLDSTGLGLSADLAVEFVGVSKQFASASSVIADTGDPDDFLEDDEEPAGDEPAITGEPRVLEDMTFSILRGTVYGVAGAHGAGKTTLLRLIAGTLIPTAGEVRVRGRVSPPPDTLGRLLNPAADGAHNLKLLARFLGLQERIPTLDVADVFSLAGLAGCEHVPFSSIPRRDQSALLVCAVVHLRPDIYLFDPAPKIADPGVREAVDELVAARVRAGAVVVLTAERADRLSADDVVVLERGRLSALAPRAAPRERTGQTPAADGRPPPPEPPPAQVSSMGSSEPMHAPDAPDAPDAPVRTGLRLRHVEVDLEGRPPMIRMVVEVPVARVDATFGFIFRQGDRNTAKLRSAQFVLREGCFEVVAYLGALAGPVGRCSLLVGVRLDHDDEEQSVSWPEPIGIDVGLGIRGPTHTSWRVEAIDPSDVVESGTVTANKSPEAENKHQQRDHER